MTEIIRQKISNHPINETIERYVVIPTDVVIKSDGGLSFKLVVSETGELTTEQL